MSKFNFFEINITKILENAELLTGGGYLTILFKKTSSINAGSFKFDKSNIKLAILSGEINSEYF